MNKKLKLYLLLGSLTGSYFLGRNIDKTISNYNTNDETAKMICRFDNLNNINDVISIINNDNEISAILKVNDKTNDFVVYLKEDTYKICSNLGINNSITIDDENDVYKLKIDYNDKNIFMQKIEDNINNQDNINNYIASDIIFDNNIRSDNLDYSNIKEDGFISQGYVIIDGDYPSILISSYKKNENSRIYIYERNNGNLLGYIILNNKNHVGGITYDKEKDILFVTASNGYINTYSYSTIMKAFNNCKNDSEVIINLNEKYNNNRSVIIKNDLNVLQHAATICYYDKNIYSIGYGLNNEIVKTSYKKIGNEIISISNETIIAENATCIQGMAFYKDNDKLYLVCSVSAGVLRSKIVIYEVNNDNNYYKKVSEKIINETSKLEGISVDKVGNISSIYEGNTTKSKIICNCKDLIEKETIDKDYFLDSLYNITGEFWNINNKVLKKK